MYGLIVVREFDPAAIRASSHYLETGEWITQAATEETMAQALEDVRRQVAAIVAEGEHPRALGHYVAIASSWRYAATARPS